MRRKFPVIVSVLLILCIIAGFLYYVYDKEQDKTPDIVVEDEIETINIWYTDEALTDYINSAALSFYDLKGIRVVPTLVSGLQYMENINKASINDDENAIPDLYVLGTDAIEKAVMSGLAFPIEDSAGTLTTDNFPDVSLDAVTYDGQKYGYPFYYETAFLLYNESYLLDMAQGDSVSANNMVPESIEDILNIANDYSAPEGVEAIFLWDVSDIFYNYFFTGAYMNIGGASGDDKTVIDIYNEDTIICMQVYQNLNQFFSIDSKESSYSSVLNSFLEGKSVFTVATTDALAAIQAAKDEGTFGYEYGIAPLPGVDGEHIAKGLSSTNCVVVNGYTGHRDAADLFAMFLTENQADNLYSRTGKLPCINLVDGSVDDTFNAIRNVYKDTAGLPKILELNNFWIYLEAAYTDIWDGADCNETLRELSERMKSQVSGSQVVEDIIIIEEDDEE